MQLPHVVPEAKWHLVSTGGTPVVPVNGQDARSPSQFWHAVDADGSLLLTWQGVLLHRAATNPVSVQAELRPSGGVTFRYDRLVRSWSIGGLKLAVHEVAIRVTLGDFSFPLIYAQIFAAKSHGVWCIIQAF